MNLQGIIFDFDGTLADTVPLCMDAMVSAIENISGKKYKYDDISEYFGYDEEGIIKILEPEKGEEAFCEYLRLIEERHHLFPDLFDSIPEILEFIKENRLKCALVTARTKPSTFISLKYYGLEKYFEYIETGSPFGLIKDVGIKKILNKWGISGEDAVYLGDTPKDIEISIKAGIKPIGVCWASTNLPDCFQYSTPYKIFNTTEELFNWIKQNLNQLMPKLQFKK